MSNARVIKITVIILALGIAGSAITLTPDKNLDSEEGETKYN